MVAGTVRSTPDNCLLKQHHCTCRGSAQCSSPVTGAVSRKGFHLTIEKSLPQKAEASGLFVCTEHCCCPLLRKMRNKSRPHLGTAFKTLKVTSKLRFLSEHQQCSVLGRAAGTPSPAGIPRHVPSQGSTFCPAATTCLEPAS